MPDRIYLKKELATNVPMIVTLKKKIGVYDEKKFKSDELTGKKEVLYVFTDDKGRELTHYAKEYEEEMIGLYGPNDRLQVVRQEKMDGAERITFHVWTPAEGAEARAAATPQLHTNSHVVAQERKQSAQADAQKEKEIGIGLRGLVQAYIIAGDEKPLAAAVSMDYEIRQEAKRLAQSSPL